MRILVYKRTHDADPDDSGCFGAYDCMGSVRNWQYHAVIGIGGTGADAVRNGIAGKINWIGIGPHKFPADDKRGPEVGFDHFLNFGKNGPVFSGQAPGLARRMYLPHVRVRIIGPSDEAYAEARRTLAAARSAPPSAMLRW